MTTNLQSDASIKAAPRVVWTRWSHSAFVALSMCMASAFAPAPNASAQGVPSERADGLVGHWRKTVIIFESTKDTHLVLHADGTAETWDVTAGSRTPKTPGRWSSSGQKLTLRWGENERVIPFTMHQGQLVMPNIAKQRVFWDRLQ